MNKGCWLNTAFMLCLSAPLWSAQADSTVNYRGNLLNEPQCVFTNEQPEQLFFGDIQISEVDGVKYAMRADLPVKCKPGAVIYLKHLAVASSFNHAAVQTNVENFGVELSLLNIRNGNFTPMPIGQRVLYQTDGIDIGNISLQAIPVKKSGVKLATGLFNGVSTIQFDIP